MGCVLFFVAVLALCAAAVQYELEYLLEYLDIATVSPVFFVANLVVRLVNLWLESS